MTYFLSYFIKTFKGGPTTIYSCWICVLSNCFLSTKWIVLKIRVADIRQTFDFKNEDILIWYWLPILVHKMKVKYSIYTIHLYPTHHDVSTLGYLNGNSFSKKNGPKIGNYFEIYVRNAQNSKPVLVLDTLEYFSCIIIIRYPLFRKCLLCCGDDITILVFKKICHDKRFRRQCLTMQF